MGRKPAERVKQLQMTTDNENRIVSIWTLTLEKTEDVIISDFTNEDGYMVVESNSTFKKPIGELLFSFMNADFSTASGFSSYVKVWGLGGLLGVNEEYVSPNIDRYHYSSIEAKEIIHSLYNLTKLILIQAQDDFKKVIDFCTNYSREHYLVSLTPLQRYHAGLLAEVIPNLDIYSKPVYVYSKPKTFAEKVIRAKTNSIEDICNSIKTESLFIETTYYSQNIVTLAYIEFFNLLYNFFIGRCANCGKYFVPKNKSNEIYCEDCRHSGYINKIKNNDLLNAYHTAYKTKHAQKQRKIKGKSTEVGKRYELALKNWRELAKLKLVLAQKEQISEKEYRDFLNSILEV
jgi:DNA-directed RNA polymerase subunit M/transcription elongation factor TFIIS